MGTEDLTMEGLCKLLETNLGFGRPTTDAETRRLVAEIRELRAAKEAKDALEDEHDRALKLVARMRVVTNLATSWSLARGRVGGSTDVDLRKAVEEFYEWERTGGLEKPLEVRSILLLMDHVEEAFKSCTHPFMKHEADLWCVVCGSYRVAPKEVIMKPHWRDILAGALLRDRTWTTPLWTVDPQGGST